MHAGRDPAVGLSGTGNDGGGWRGDGVGGEGADGDGRGTRGSDGVDGKGVLEGDRDGGGGGGGGGERITHEPSSSVAPES